MIEGSENNSGFRLDIDFNDAHEFHADYSMLENSANETWASSTTFSANPRFEYDYTFILSDESPLIGAGAVSSGGITAPTVDICLLYTSPSPRD